MSMRIDNATNIEMLKQELVNRKGEAEEAPAAQQAQAAAQDPAGKEIDFDDPNSLASFMSNIKAPDTGSQLIAEHNLDPKRVSELLDLL